MKATNLQEVVTEAFIAFQSGSAGKVACPELMGTISIWEEVIIFHRPVQNKIG